MITIFGVEVPVLGLSLLLLFLGLLIHYILHPPKDESDDI